MKRFSTPTPSLLQLQLSSAQATKPSAPGEPPAPFFPVGTTQPGQESIPSSGARRKWAQPCHAGGEEGFHSHCSHSDSLTMGEGVGGRRRLRVGPTSRSSTNWGLPASLPRLCFLTPLPGFSHSSFLLSFPSLPCLSAGSSGQGGQAQMPVTCCQPLLALWSSLWHSLCVCSHHPQLKSNTQGLRPCRPHPTIPTVGRFS